MGVPQEFWNQAYSDGSYLTQWDYDYPSQELIGVLSAINLLPGSKILDLGCGGGRDAIYMAQQGFSVSGIDLSAAAVEIAQRRAIDLNTTVDWRVGNVLNLPFANNSFEMITDRACFHHISHQDRTQYAIEVSRILSVGGLLLIRGSYHENADSFFAVTKDSIQDHFGNLGFQIGPLLPIALVNNSGKLTANMVLLRKAVR
ncbi:MAG: methyltransferase domain-containing protein [Oligoflexia bacterium]|nr:methyltransferase domain-containing protein [Oligoflexia bacterium]MBF0367483.1 methyltransferase domain-containing protein [Oligoflexia bacterium]